VAHLYACQELSTYRIADLTGISRQRVTRLLHRAGMAVKSRGAGRRRPGAADPRYPVAFLAAFYLESRLSCAEISGLTGIPPRTIRDRLVASSVRMRTRGGSNREDRIVLDPALLADLYQRADLPAGEVGKAFGVSRRIVLRTAHEEGLPVRIGGPPPRRGPDQIELINALYADPVVRHALARHGLPQVPPDGPIWQRFPVPATLTREQAGDLYESCGLSVTHIELLTGRPADSVRKMLIAAGVTLRAPGGRSPFLRRWRAAQASSGPRGEVNGRLLVAGGPADHNDGGR